MLYVVPTPIGNLSDITIRALEVLKSVELIIAEDTRNTFKLLKHFDIKTPMTSYHMHNEHKILLEIVDKLKQGKNIALVSDAGTPAISDPGFLLVREARKQDIEIDVLPGACAAIVALVGSAIPCESFVFEGFLPEKKGRQTKLEELKNEKRTMIFYSSPHKFLKNIADFKKYFGEQRRACVCRELTKIYQEYKTASLTEIEEYYTAKPPKGEIVVVVEGFKEEKKKKYE